LSFVSHPISIIFCEKPLPAVAVLGSSMCFFYRVEGIEKFCEETAERRQWLITA